ncbi:MAG TPA: DUF4112 domain-containing protein [Kofleriaceae bacterium]|nr:DUF4112 domain-containing protein [Kofleriaceae bacterium]
MRLPPYVAPRPRRGTGTRTDAELERVRKMARVLDRYMLDPIVGLILPGAGDIVGSLLGLYTVAIALRRRMSPVIVARMLLNLGLDALIGIVPLVGDVADVGFKANTRNAELLIERGETGGRATAKDWLMVVGAGLLFVVAVALAVFLVGKVGSWIASQF